MKKSQLIEVLTTLEKSEVREFKKWLQSPVHNQREDVVQLFDYLMAGNHLSKDKFLEKERIFRKVFGNEAYNDAKLRQTIHFLNRSLEEYLSYKDWKEDEIRSKVPLISQFRKRKLSKNFNHSLKHIEQAQEAQPFRSDRFFRNEYLLQLELYAFIQERRRSPTNNLQKVSHTLDKNYFIEKLKLSCRMIFHQRVYKKDYDYGLLHKVLSYIEEYDLVMEPAIAVYYYIFKAVTEEEKDQLFFEKLRLSIYSSGDLFPHNEKREVYLMAINYCIGKMNSGVEEFVREAYEWYRQGFENDILVENEMVSRWTYLNVALIALRLKEFSWAKNFIAQYKDLIEEGYRESFYSYTLARMYFEQNDYDQAMQLLLHYDHDDLLINLNARTLLIKIYYEQEEIDALESLLDSTRIYLKRKKVQGNHRMSYQNVIKFMKKLIRINPFDKTGKEGLRAELLNANPVAEKNWLIEQLEKI